MLEVFRGYFFGLIGTTVHIKAPFGSVESALKLLDSMGPAQTVMDLRPDVLRGETRPPDDRVVAHQAVLGLGEIVDRERGFGGVFGEAFLMGEVGGRTL